MSEGVRCGPDNGIALFLADEIIETLSAAPKGCRHGQQHWQHVHWRLGGQPMCRSECRCGKIMAPDGRVGGETDPAEWGWREGRFG